jgi:predicted PurR-regulated permease PerM
MTTLLFLIVYLIVFGINFLLFYLLYRFLGKYIVDLFKSINNMSNNPKIDKILPPKSHYQQEFDKITNLLQKNRKK